MAVNYVKGQILSDILERDGLDISIANANVGINTTSPTVALDVYGNVQANNFNTTGSANTGNITGANVISSVTLCAFGNVYANNLNATANITGGNLNITANVAAGNVLTDHLLYANGTPWDLQEPAGSNTEIQFNNNSQFGATANFTFDTAGNLLTVNATANIANVNVAGNITGGNVLFGNGIVSGTGNIYGRIFWVEADTGGIAWSDESQEIFNNRTADSMDIVSHTGAIRLLAISSAVGGVSFVTAGGTATYDVNGNFSIPNSFSAGGNLVIVNNIGANTANITGNVTVGNISTVGNVAAGNVLTNHLLYANGAPWDLQEPAGSNTQIQFNNNSQFGATANFTFDTAANLLAVNATANIANINVAGAAVVQGNVTGGNLLTGGVVSASANVTGGNLITGGLISATGNVYTPRIQNGSTGMYMDAGYPGYINFFNSNGTKVTIDDNGNINGGVVSMTGNVTGGNVLTGGVVSAAGNVRGSNLNTAGLVTATGNVTGGNILTDGLISAAGNITSGNLTIANTVIVATSANSTVTLQPTGTGLVNINTTTGLILPVGNTDQRPGYPTYATTPLATIRYNNNLDQIEYFDGINWTEVGAVATQLFLINKLHLMEQVLPIH